MKSIKSFGIKVAGITMAMLLAASGAQAADSVTLRFEHFLPASSNAQKGVIEPWCEDLQEKSEGRIQCEIYPSMQLGGKPAQLADLVRNGVIDIAWTALGYSAGRFPRSEVMELPFVLPYDGLKATEIIWDYSQTTAKDDFKDYQVLAVYSDVGGIIHTSKKEVQSLDDMKGLRIRASTRLASKLMDALGGTPVSMPPGQIADSLSKGVIDGAMASWEVVPPTKLDETTFFHTQVTDNQAAPVLTILAVLMNKKSYANMPDDLRAILDEHSGAVLSQRFAQSWDDAVKAAEKQVSAEDGQTVVTLDDDTYLAFKEASQPVIDEWLASKGGGLDRPALFEELEKKVQEVSPDLVR